MPKCQSYKPFPLYTWPSSANLATRPRQSSSHWRDITATQKAAKPRRSSSFQPRAWSKRMNGYHSPNFAVSRACTYSVICLRENRPVLRSRLHRRSSSSVRYLTQFSSLALDWWLFSVIVLPKVVVIRQGCAFFFNWHILITKVSFFHHIHRLHSGLFISL